MNPVTDRQVKVCSAIMDVFAGLPRASDENRSYLTREGAAIFQGIIDALSLVIAGLAAQSEWTPAELDSFLQLITTRLEEDVRSAVKEMR